jgi:tRNA pseudouridine38-40 synthase
MNFALGIEYDGGAFCGFQLQKHAPSVQGALEGALSGVAAAPIRVVPAGRTDAGVHATGQVVSFASPVERPLKAWVRGANAQLPEGVRVTWAREVDAGFSARYSAVARRYMYLFVEQAYEHEAASPLLRGRAVEVRGLDESAMHRAAQALLGEQDFSAVRAAGCQSRTGFRCVHRVSVQRAGPFVVLDITANAFLLHMVRNIAGVLAQVGEGRRPEAWVAELLAGRDRTVAGPTAPPHGLYLVHVHYPGYGFPVPQVPPLLRVLGGLDRF